MVLVGSAVDPSLVTFARRLVQPPADTYVTKDDVLHVTTRVEYAALDSTFTISLRVLTVPGKVQVLRYSYKASSYSTPTVNTFPLLDGYILGLSVTIDTIPAADNRLAHVLVAIARGYAGSSIALQGLAGGYIDSATPIFWPGSPIRDIRDGPGRRRTIAGSVYLIGTPYVWWTPDAGLCWRVAMANSSLATSATAGNRVVMLRIQPDAGGGFIVKPSTNQSEGTTFLYTAAVGIATALRGVANLELAFPDQVFIRYGGYVRWIIESGYKANDTWTAGDLFVHEWFDR
jgi:hypothetical protein